MRAEVWRNYLSEDTWRSIPTALGQGGRTRSSVLSPMSKTHLPETLAPVLLIHQQGRGTGCFPAVERDRGPADDCGGETEHGMLEGSPRGQVQGPQEGFRGRGCPERRPAPSPAIKTKFAVPTDSRNGSSWKANLWQKTSPEVHTQSLDRLDKNRSKGKAAFNGW